LLQTGVNRFDEHICGPWAAVCSVPDQSGGLTLDYDYRYGAKTGPGTTDQFVESIYKSLTKKN
jgi:hypothetical protein